MLQLPHEHRIGTMLGMLKQAGFSWISASLSSTRMRIDHICASLLGGPPTIAMDRTASKIAELAQLGQGLLPSFDNLEAYLYQHLDVKLPVTDAKYYSLIAANEALMSKVEPASASGAEALAVMVTTALRMEYMPVEDEESLPGAQAQFT